MLELRVASSTRDLDPTIGVKLLDQVLAGNRWHAIRYTRSVYPATAITTELQADARIAFAQGPPGIGRKRPSLPGEPPGVSSSLNPERTDDHGREIALAVDPPYQRTRLKGRRARRRPDPSSHRAGSVVVTSNRAPDEWLATFADPVRAQSTIDRFVSNAYDLVIEGESYRPRLKPSRQAGQKAAGQGGSIGSAGWNAGENPAVPCS